MPTLTRSLTVAALIALAACSSGQDAPADIQISDAWARATVPGQSSAAAYLTIANSGQGADRLVAVASSIASEASLHSSSSEGGVMRMRKLDDGLAVPADATVKLAPSGNHVMLTGLARPLAQGSSFPLTLTFERSGERQVTVEVVDPAAAAGGMAGMEGM